MATIRETITSKLRRYNIELTEAEIDAELIAQGLTPEDEFSVSADKQIKLALVRMIPELLLSPDIQEGDLSIRFDRQAIMKYYSYLCKELGVPDKLNSKPTIRSKSNYW